LNSPNDDSNASPIADRLAAVRHRIDMACRGAGRSPDSVTLVAVSKTMPVEAVQAAWAAGARVFGENRVQEAEGKILALRACAGAGAGADSGGGAPYAGIAWHLVGHLQSNKAGRAVELFDLIHSVDDAELARALGRRALALEARGRVKKQAVLVQVNCSGEASKSGCDPAVALELAAQVHRTPGVELRGFMTIGPLEPGDAAAAEEGARRAFGRLRALRDRVQEELGTALPELSMGMTGDLEVALEEGATLVRIGTAVF
jgi:pyridoxal phosphate enzyme (YggS family)